MLSAVLKRVKSLEKRLDKQGNNIEELKRRINGPLLTESDKISSVADIKEILLRYQAKLKEQGFEMNHIKSKITTQEENVQKIKLDLIRLRSEKQRVQQYESQQQQQQQVSNSREQLALDRTQAYNPAVECLLGRGGSYHGPLLPNVPIPPQLAPGNYLETQPNVTEPGPMYNPSLKTMLITPDQPKPLWLTDVLRSLLAQTRLLYGTILLIINFEWVHLQCRAST